MNNFGFNNANSAIFKKINIDENFTHAMIVGETGSGKTTSAILPHLKDRIEKGWGVLVYDYKGGEHKKIKHLALKCGRLKDVVMINVP
ncbi:type IV secretory system conjugative DNA transfer family protein [Campylobacter sputorum]|uniref:type IV secretory system conjugative DNA transfer family protein n=1 Tax=Campylobacter sputorum TaxID=206 RepID=UPI000B782826|nr:type IV secretory system conjugative DNA transfer family protein [Campylobacter sputorum]